MPYIEQPEISQSFKKHLEIEDNERILFTSAFGAGKSTFLNDFFSRHPEYIVLKCYPVNYSVASNEDIFELVKHDLIAELIGKYNDVINLDDEEFSVLLSAGTFIFHEFKVAPFAQAAIDAAVPEQAKTMLGTVKDTWKRFLAYKDKVNQNEEKLLSDYFKWIEKQKGSIYERDEITLLINDFIGRLKDFDSQKKIVLLIDDLDRLDPEHIFRLLNIFSAHYHGITSKNKFGVDKIIIVCDIDTIQSLFYNRYGMSARFTNYIDKFYSRRPYYFDNAEYLIRELRELITSRHEIDVDQNYYKSAFFKRHSPFLRESSVTVMVTIFATMVKSNKITFRDITQSFTYDLPTYNLSSARGQSYPSYAFDILVWLHLLKKCFTNLKDLSKTLDELQATGYQNYLSLTGRNGILSAETLQFHVVRACIPFLIPFDEIFRDRGYPESEETIIELGFDNLEIFFTRKYDWDTELITITNYRVQKNSDKITQPDFQELDIFKLLYYTTTKIVNDGRTFNY